MSKVSEERRSWLDQVKLDAEELTRKRLAEDLPKLEQEVAARQAKSEAKEAEAEKPAEAEMKEAEAPKKGSK